MKFVQTIEYTTSRFEECQATLDEFLAATEGKRTLSRAATTRDRDKPNTYIDIVEFPSYEAAEKNNALPETGSIMSKMMALCDGPPTFRNLDVVREDS